MRSVVEDIRLHRCLADLRDAYASLRWKRTTIARILIVACIERLERVLASVDTHPKDGDVQQAPLVSGAVAAGETPNPHPILPNKERTIP
jgi:hypothetical protein